MPAPFWIVAFGLMIAALTFMMYDFVKRRR